MTTWDKILSSLQHKINRQSFNTWLKPTQQMSLADGMLQVEVPSLLFADWISRNYLPLIQESAREIECSGLQFHFSSRQAPAPAREVAYSAPVPGNGSPIEAPAGADGAARLAVAPPHGLPAPPFWPSPPGSGPASTRATPLTRSW